MISKSIAQLLDMLADGRWHTGKSLGENFGITRNAVWKQITQLEKLGLQIERSKATGYRLLNQIQLLDVDVIDRACKSSSVFSDLCYEPVIGSTNDHLLSLPARFERGAVCVTEQQTAGRGRRGRSWLSPYAQNVYASFSLPVAGGAQAVEGLSLAVGVAVTQSLQDCGVQGARLKWPNDIVGPSGKLGGVLIDVAGDPLGDLVVVIGVGLNLTLLDDQVQSIDQAAQGVSDLGFSGTRTDLVLALINRLSPLCQDYASSGFAAWREAWSALDAFAEQPVKVVSGDNQIFGTSIGVDDTGRYGIQLENGDVHWCSGGEVSLRRGS